MALHNLKITVIDGGKADSSILGGTGDDNGSGSSSSSSSKKTGSNLLSKVFNYNSTIRNWTTQHFSPSTAFAIQQGASLLIQTGKEFVNYYVSDIGRANGDSNYQAIVNRKIEQVTDVTSILQGAWMGAAAGSMTGNPIGIAIGAAVGVTSSAINLGFKYATREREYQHEMFQENTSQAYQLARANYSAYTGRVR